MKDSLNLVSSFFIKLNRSSARAGALGAFASSVLLLACSSQPDRTGQSSTGGVTSGSGGSFSETGGAPSDTGGATSSTGGAADTGGTTGTGGSDITPPPPAHCDTAAKEALPLTVSDHFQPSGWMPDGTGLLIPEGETCPEPPTEAVGTCYVFDFLSESALQGWAGMAFLPGVDNWDGPGICVADGATKITFHARGDQGGEVVSFGGVMEGTGTGDVTLTNEWQAFEFSIPSTYNISATYGGVTSGFTWTMGAATQAAESGPNYRIYVAGIQWVTE
jgi:hypothetical protein